MKRYFKIADGFRNQWVQTENTDETLIQYNKLLQSKNSTEKKKLLNYEFMQSLKIQNELSKIKVWLKYIE